jgi:hypothetical protein
LKIPACPIPGPDSLAGELSQLFKEDNANLSKFFSEDRERENIYELAL